MGLIIYKSSAGSGKTFTLVRDFLSKTIEKPWLFKRILAITFTNKATEELKTRLIRELDLLSSGRGSDHLKWLIEHLSPLDEKAIRNNAGTILESILHNYSAFAVSTIDSFFQDLARSLAREMQLPMKFTLELDSEAICRNISNLLIDEAGKDERITAWLESMLLHRIDEGKSWMIRSELEKMTRQLLNSEDARTHSRDSSPEHLLPLINWMKEVKTDVEGEMRKLGFDFLEVLESNGLEVGLFSQKGSGPAGYLANLAIKKPNYKVFGNINSYVNKAIEDPLAFLKTADRKDQRLTAIVENELHPLLTEAVAFYQANQAKYMSVVEGLKLIWQSGIAGALDEKLRQYREDNQLFHISDTTRMLSTVISGQDTPFVYEKTGNTFFHVFIDEFQDTSLEQWCILRPLVMNSLANGNDVILVGDAKQSIYRWRGGDISLIVDKVGKEVSQHGHPAESRELKTNWRSSKEIIAFNNTFFPAAAQLESARFDEGNDLFEKAYHEESVKQSHNSKAGEGYVCLRLFETVKGLDEEEKAQGHWKQQALHAMNATIDACIDQGYKPGDIAILVRTNDHELLVADHLFQHGNHRFISSNSLLLARNEQVHLLLNCFRIIIDPNNSLLHAEVNSRMQPEVTGADIPLEKTGINNPRSSWTHHYLLKLRSRLIEAPVSFVLDYCIRQTGMDPCNPFIQKFSDILIGFQVSGGHSLSGFLHWWDEHVDTRNWSVDLPDAGQAIRIMTIHRSKGLEFPVVILPLLDWSLFPKSHAILWAKGREFEFDKHGKLPIHPVRNLEETAFREDYRKETLDTAVDNLNLLYVAFTRPEHKLFVFGPARPKSGDVCKLLLDVIDSNAEWSKRMNENGGSALTIGTDHPKPAKDDKEKQNDPFFLPLDFTPSTVEGEKKDSLLDLPALQPLIESEEILIGELVHEILSRETMREQPEQTITRVLVSQKPQPGERIGNKVSQKALFMDELLRSRGWYDKRFREINEQDLCSESGGILRPDKILSSADQTIVIDFKTGKRSEKHEKQVLEYCRILQAVGLPGVEGHLVYTDSAEIVPVA